MWWRRGPEAAGGRAVLAESLCQGDVQSRGLLQRHAGNPTESTLGCLWETYYNVNNATSCPFYRLAAPPPGDHY